MDDLISLNKRYGADKSALIPIYDLHFRHLRDSVTKVLELGVQTGNSLSLWDAYFPNANIVGMDINPASITFSNRITFLRGDVNDRDNLDKLISLGPYDIIIDDCNYFWAANQIKCFNYLISSCKSLYSIEDIGNDSGDVTKSNLLLDFIKIKAYNLQGPDKYARHPIEDCPSNLGDDLGAIHIYHQLLIIEKRKVAK